MDDRGVSEMHLARLENECSPFLRVSSLEQYLHPKGYIALEGCRSDANLTVMLHEKRKKEVLGEVDIIEINWLSKSWANR